MNPKGKEKKKAIKKEANKNQIDMNQFSQPDNDREYEKNQKWFAKYARNK